MCVCIGCMHVCVYVVYDVCMCVYMRVCETLCLSLLLYANKMCSDALASVITVTEVYKGHYVASQICLIVAALCISHLQSSIKTGRYNFALSSLSLFLWSGFVSEDSGVCQVFYSVDVLKNIACSVKGIHFISVVSVVWILCHITSSCLSCMCSESCYVAFYLYLLCSLFLNLAFSLFLHICCAVFVGLPWSFFFLLICRACVLNLPYLFVLISLVPLVWILLCLAFFNCPITVCKYACHMVL